jgi:membrane-associated phospholipid phosphatase
MTAARSDGQRLAAMVLSIVGHPLIVMPLTVLISVRQPFFRTLIYAGITILPLMFVIRRKVRAKEWTDHDVSEPRQRREFYWVLLVVLGGSIALFSLFGFPRPLIVGTAVSFGLLVLGMVISLWSKISIHMMFCAYSAMILTRIGVAASIIALGLLLTLGWARVVLGRHTVPQVISGAAMGAIAGLVLLRLLGG